MKNPSIQKLRELYLREHYRKMPNIPQQCRITPKYSDKTANGLTKCIIDWLRLNGCQCERVNVMGRPIDRRRIVTDCIGRKKQIGSLQWIKSGSQRGSADISAIIARKSVKIEVKAGHDRMSEAQKEYKRQVEAAGGYYVIARSFEQFLDCYYGIIDWERDNWNEELEARNPSWFDTSIKEEEDLW